MYLRIIAPALLGVIFLASAPAWADPPVYEVIDLGRGYAGAPQDVNESNLPVGNRGFAHIAKGTIWTTAGQPEFLSTPGSEHNNSTAMGVNNSGLIAGWSEFDAAHRLDSQHKHACLWDAGVHQWLDEPAAATNSQANDVNDLGVAVGTWNTWSLGMSSNVDVHAIKWLADGTAVDLSVPGEWASQAYAVNLSDQIAGAWFDNSGWHAVRWDSDGNPQNIGDLYGVGAMAFGLNDAGEVVGESVTANGGRMAFFWDGQMHALDTLGNPEDDFYQAVDINNSGLIVGHVFDRPGNTLRPLLWWENEAYDLNDLLEEPFVSSNYGSVTFTEALAVNESGVIAVMGNSAAPFGATRPYLLVPVPEPSTWALLVIASVGVLLRRVRVRRDRSDV